MSPSGKRQRMTVERGEHQWIGAVRRQGRCCAVAAAADTGLLAPDVAPQRAVGSGTDGGAFFGVKGS